MAIDEDGRVGGWAPGLLLVGVVNTLLVNGPK
jgi:hypothetical protein